MKILHKGAEAILYKEDNNLIKERITKGYRHKVIDKNKTKYPTRREFKLLTKAKDLINVPNPIKVEENDMVGLKDAISMSSIGMDAMIKNDKASVAKVVKNNFSYDDFKNVKSNGESFISMKFK